MNAKKYDEEIINKQYIKTEPNISLKVLKNSLEINASELSIYKENKAIYPKGSKEFNLSTLSATGWTLFLSSVVASAILTVVSSSSQQPQNSTTINTNLVAGGISIGVTVLDIIIAPIIGNMEKKEETNNSVIEKKLSNYNYRLSIGDKLFTGNLDETGYSRIDNLTLSQSSLKYGKGKLTVFMNKENIYEKDIEVEQMDLLIK